MLCADGIREELRNPECNIMYQQRSREQTSRVKCQLPTRSESVKKLSGRTKPFYRKPKVTNDMGRASSTSTLPESPLEAPSPTLIAGSAISNASLAGADGGNLQHNADSCNGPTVPKYTRDLPTWLQLDTDVVSCHSSYSDHLQLENE